MAVNLISLESTIQMLSICGLKKRNHSAIIQVIPPENSLLQSKLILSKIL